MTIPSWAKPGAKVVCVDGEFPADMGYGYETLPRTGEIYTVRSIRQHHSGGWGIYLLEIQNPEVEYAGGCWEAFFAVGRFRPVTSLNQEQDVALFTHLLDGLPIREEAQ